MRRSEHCFSLIEERFRIAKDVILAAQSGHPSLAALSAIVRGYDVDTWWLVCGESEQGSDVPPERRVGTLNLLSELGTTLTLQRRLRSATPPVSDGLANA